MIDALVPSKVLDTDGQLLDSLREGSEVLQNITDVFTPLMKNFRIYFFWEQEKTDFGTTLSYVCPPFFSRQIKGSKNNYRWLRRVLLRLFWMTLNELVYHTTISTCANLRVGTLQGTGWLLQL